MITNKTAYTRHYGPPVRGDEYAYLCLLNEALKAPLLPDRTGTGRRSVFGRSLKFDLSDMTLPVITTKRVWLRAVIHELMWFISGSPYITYLRENGVSSIWEPWADEDGYVGNLYGAQWRRWEHPFPDEENGWVNAYELAEIDQLRDLERNLDDDPHSRRHIMTSWHVGDVFYKNLALPPCHGLVYQLCVDDEGGLHAIMYQRSADLFLGVPFNITSYALLTHLFAHTCAFDAMTLTIMIGDAHVYANHEDAVREQLQRDVFPFPRVKINPDLRSVCRARFEDIEVIDYQHHPAIRAPVAV